MADAARASLTDAKLTFLGLMDAVGTNDLRTVRNVLAGMETGELRELALGALAISMLMLINLAYEDGQEARAALYAPQLIMRMRTQLLADGSCSCALCGALSAVAGALTTGRPL